MRTLRFVLGDQLSRSIASLADLDPANDVVFLCEVADEATYVRHHKQKIAFLFSAMRHFAEELRGEGITVDYVRLDGRGNTGSFGSELARAAKRHRATGVVVVEPGEWRVAEAMSLWEATLGIPVEIRTDDRFLCSGAAFAEWADTQKGFRMEAFYRHMRKRTGILMDGDAPVGGKWNLDHENRKPLPPRIEPPPLPAFEPDAITREVLALVERRFGDHFGSLRDFRWAVTRAGALEALRHFIDERLPRFGDYQDAMRTGEDFLFHAVLSPYINAGLLLPREVVDAAEAAYAAGDVPINAAEGFIRQILGWREYIRGVYWAKMPGYGDSNALAAERPLPWFYWSGETDMHCLSEAIRTTAEHGYAHHIQRLMITGNFALIAGLRPAEVAEWYLVVYADAYEWVELPNVHGMILYADGGVLGSKPYASSGQYIDRMSDYCGRCRYDVRQRTGPDACPFNALYWDFMIRNAERLRGNPRLTMPYRTLDRMTAKRKAEFTESAARFLRSDAMSPDPEPPGRRFPRQQRLL